MGGVEEVVAFLSSIGLEQCEQAVVQNGFYTSMAALKGATYEELLDSGVRPMHAKLILSQLGSRGASQPRAGAAQTPAAATADDADEVVTFLRSVGLENCAQPLQGAGFNSLDSLSTASQSDLLEAGLKPARAHPRHGQPTSAPRSGARPRLAGARASDHLQPGLGVEGGHRADARVHQARTRRRRRRPPPRRRAEDALSHPSRRPRRHRRHTHCARPHTRTRETRGHGE